MFRAIAIAGALVVAVPASANAAEAVIKNERASVNYVDGFTRCVEHPKQKPPYADCGLYSGQILTLSGNVYAGNGFSPLSSAYRVKLQPYDIKTNRAIGGARAIKLNGSKTSFSFAITAGVSTRYRIYVLKTGSTANKAAGRSVYAGIKARIVDQSVSSQHSTSFAVKGKVAFRDSFQGGTFKVQRCKSNTASYCQLSNNARWGAVLYSKSMKTAGTWSTHVGLTGSVTYIRYTFVPRNSRNLVSHSGIYVTRF